MEQLKSFKLTHWVLVAVCRVIYLLFFLAEAGTVEITQIHCSVQSPKLIKWLVSIRQ